MTAFGFWLACLGGMFAAGYLGQKADEWRDRREAAKAHDYKAPWGKRAPGEIGGGRGA